MGRAIEEPQLSPQDSQEQSHHNYNEGNETPSDTCDKVENDRTDETNLRHKKNIPQALQPQANPHPVPYPPQGEPQAYPALPEHRQRQAYHLRPGIHVVRASMGYHGPGLVSSQMTGTSMDMTGTSMGNQGPSTSNSSPLPPPAVGNEGGIDETVASLGNQGVSTSNRIDDKAGDKLGNQAIWTEGWSSGLFDCMDDPPNAIITACFPCVTYGRIAKIVDNGQSTCLCLRSGLLYVLIGFLTGCPCILSCSVRSKVRSRYGLDKSYTPDWITHCFCELCALCQEYREINHQGCQNVVKQQEATMAPPMNQTMM